MSPEVRKAVVLGLVNELFARISSLVNEYSKIRAEVNRLGEKPIENRGHVARTALEVLDELEASGHMEKLSDMTVFLGELRRDVIDTDAEDEYAFRSFIPRIEKIHEEATDHFERVIPPMHDKLATAMRQALESN